MFQFPYHPLWFGGLVLLVSPGLPEFLFGRMPYPVHNLMSVAQMVAFVVYGAAILAAIPALVRFAISARRSSQSGGADVFLNQDETNAPR